MIWGRGNEPLGTNMSEARCVTDVKLLMPAHNPLPTKGKLRYNATTRVEQVLMVGPQKNQTATAAWGLGQPVRVWAMWCVLRWVQLRTAVVRWRDSLS